MAETVDDRSMSNKWMLLRDVRAFVAQHSGGSDRAAENLIIEYAANGHFKSYRYHQPKSSDPIAGGIAPRSWGFASPLLGCYVCVDFTESAVAWMRGKPGNYALSLFIEDKLEEAGVLPPYDYRRITLVRLLRSEVLTMLQAEGLLEAPLTTAAAQNPAFEAPKKAPKKPLPKVQRIIREVLRHEWPPDGTPPHGVDKAELERRVRAGWVAACGKLEIKHPLANNLRSSINRTLERLRD
jgi:hypothetical protein